LTGVKNPIYVAQKLLEVAEEGLLPLGRVPPMYVEQIITLVEFLYNILWSFMVGGGAAEWAKEHGLETVANSKLLTG
jgi:hypothetical protein